MRKRKLVINYKGKDYRFEWSADGNPTDADLRDMQAEIERHTGKQPQKFSPKTQGNTQRQVPPVSLNPADLFRTQGLAGSKGQTSTSPPASTAPTPETQRLFSTAKLPGKAPAAPVPPSQKQGVNIFHRPDVMAQVKQQQAEQQAAKAEQDKQHLAQMSSPSQMAANSPANIGNLEANAPEAMAMGGIRQTSVPFLGGLHPLDRVQKAIKAGFAGIGALADTGNIGGSIGKAAGPEAQKEYHTIMGMFDLALAGVGAEETGAAQAAKVLKIIGEDIGINSPVLLNSYKVFANPNSTEEQKNEALSSALLSTALIHGHAGLAKINNALKGMRAESQRVLDNLGKSEKFPTKAQNLSDATGLNVTAVSPEGKPTIRVRAEGREHVPPVNEQSSPAPKEKKQSIVDNAVAKPNKRVAASATPKEGASATSSIEQKPSTSTEPTPTSAEPTPKDFVSMRRATLNRMEKTGEISELERTKARTREQLAKEADNTTIEDALNLAKKVKDGGSIDELTSPKLTKGMQLIQKLLEENRIQMEKINPANPMLKELQHRQEILRDYKQDLANTHSKYVGVKASEMLRGIQGGLEVDTGNVTSVLEEADALAKERGAGKGLTHPERAKLKELTEQNAELQRKIEEVQKQKAARAAKDSLDNLKTQAKTGRRFARSQEEILAERKNLHKNLTKALSKASANPFLDPELHKAILDLTKSYVEEGIGTLEDVVNKFKEDHPSLSKETILQAIGKPLEAKRAKPSVEQLSKTNTLRLIKGIADKTNQVESDNITPKQKAEARKLTLQEEALKNRSNLLDKKIKAKLEELKPKTFTEKATRTLRGLVLTSPATFLKLNSSALSKFFVTPAEQLAGKAVSQIPAIGRIAKMAPNEGYASLATELAAKAYRYKEGWPEAYRTFKTGYSNLEAKYGAPVAEGLMGIPGRLHDVAKTPTLLEDYFRRVASQAEYYKNRGADISNPTMHELIKANAYEYALRAKYANKNLITSATNDFVSKSPPLKAVKNLRVLFDKIPTNLELETLEDSGGLPAAIAKTIKAYKSGIENLTPHEADTIMRLYKKGMVGAAGFAMGAYMVGRQYVPHSKGKQFPPKGQAFGQIKGSTSLGDIDIPPQIAEHVPFLNLILQGAHWAQRQKEHQGLIQPILENQLITLENIPVIKSIKDTSEFMSDETERNRQLGAIVPSGAKYLAGMLDEYRNPTNRSILEKAMRPGLKRKPKTLEDQFKMANPFPGGRDSVPLSKNQ